MKPDRNPRRAYDEEGREIRPMDLANMRAHGVRSFDATCERQDCGHEATVNVDHLPAAMPVPDVGLRMVCSKCGGRRINTRPDWTQSRPHGKP